MNTRKFRPRAGKVLSILLLGTFLGACGSGSKNDNDSDGNSSANSSSNSSATSSLNSSSTSLSDSSSSSSFSSSSSVESSSPSADITLGAQQYQTHCESCHGTEGTGTTPINIANGLPDHHVNLEQFIQENMPKNNPGHCTDEENCAINVAGYIKTWAFTAQTTTGYTIETMDECSVDGPSTDNSILFEDATINGIVGWNGIGTNAPWTGLAQTPTSPAYNVPGVIAPDVSCDNAQTQTTTIVKKYANWEHQHSNGVNIPLSGNSKTFGTLGTLVLELKLNSNNTRLFTKQQLHTIYGELLTDAQYDILDLGKAALAVTFQSPSPSSTRVSAERYIEIEPALMDRWLRITIPVSTMDFFTGDVWQKTAPPEAEALATTPLDNIHIVGETYGTRRDVPTSYGDVIRNLLGGPSDADWNSRQIPETFKEMSITFKKMEIIWQ